MTASRWTASVILADLVWMPAALFSAGVLRYGLGEAAWPFSFWGFVLAVWLIWLLLSAQMELDGFRGGWRLPAVISQVFVAVLCEMCSLLAIAYLARHYVSRLALFYFGALLLVGFTAIRCTAWLLIRARHRAGEVWRVVVMGEGRVARELAESIARHPELLCRVVGILLPQQESTEDSEVCGRTGKNSVQLSTFGIIDFLQAQHVNEVILALSQAGAPEIRNLVARCDECGIRISVVPQPYELYLAKPRFLDVDGVPVLRFCNPGPSLTYLRSKRALDMVLGSTMTVAALPMLIPVACGLWIRKRRAFRSEIRCGRSGKTFSMLRFNVDRHVIHESRFDELLEILSISELPQLWNVIRGDMSLVGPRPEPPAAVSRYSDWHQQRLKVKPGMTGLAQVHGLRDENSSEQKARFDLQYLMNPSILADLSLLLQTVWTLATRLVHYSESTRRGLQRNLSSSNAPSLLIQEALSSAHSTQSSAD